MNKKKGPLSRSFKEKIIAAILYLTYNLSASIATGGSLTANTHLPVHHRAKVTLSELFGLHTMLRKCKRLAQLLHLAACCVSSPSSFLMCRELPPNHLNVWFSYRFSSLLLYKGTTLFLIYQIRINNFNNAVKINNRNLTKYHLISSGITWE